MRAITLFSTLSAIKYRKQYRLPVLSERFFIRLPAHLIMPITAGDVAEKIRHTATQWKEQAPVAG